MRMSNSHKMPNDLEKEHRRFLLFDLKTYNKATIIKAVRNWRDK